MRARYYCRPRWGFTTNSDAPCTNGLNAPVGRPPGVVGNGDNHFSQLLQREYAGRFLQRGALSLGRPRAAAPVSRIRLVSSRLVLV